jgi:hypothetical protein
MTTLVAAVVFAVTIFTGPDVDSAERIGPTRIIKAIEALIRAVKTTQTIGRLSNQSSNASGCRSRARLSRSSLFRASVVVAKLSAIAAQPGHF